MTPEEIEAKIKALGLDVGKWDGVEEHKAGSERFHEIVEGLTQLRDILSGAAEADREKILELKLQVNRMKRGGGR